MTVAGAKKILIVDDTALDRARLAAIVRSLGCEPIELSHPDQVVETASHHQPILVVLDVVMGPPNGFEVCRQLREAPSTRHLPVVLCSVKATDVDHAWAKQQGAWGYLGKPLDPERARLFLQKQIQRALDHRATQGART